MLVATTVAAIGAGHGRERGPRVYDQVEPLRRSAKAHTGREVPEREEVALHLHPQSTAANRLVLVRHGMAARPRAPEG
eukprot:scaffold39848_cov64-Phaeocystis_antarctica.AAC.4